MIRLELFFVSISLLISTFVVSQNDWELTKEKNGIKIFTKSSEENSLKSFKATIHLNCTVDRFVFELLNIDHFIDWGYKMKSVELLERKGDTVQVYYAESKAPFPFKNRDGIYRNTFRWDSELRTLTVPIEVLHDYLPENENNIRVKGTGYWTVKSISEKKQFVTFEMHLDPGGSIPTWLANMFVSDSPYGTLIGLKEVVEKKKEIKVTYDFLK